MKKKIDTPPEKENWEFETFIDHYNFVVYETLLNKKPT
jgi:hypothetical protein